MLRDQLHQAICQIPVIDIHSHLCPVRKGARRLEHVVFYHMITYALRTAGVPEEAIWSDDPHAKPTRTGDAWEHLPAVWPQIAATSFGWILSTILRELYDFDEPITADSLPRLRDAFERQTARPDWGNEVMARGPIARVLSSRTFPTPAPGVPDTLCRQTLEKAPLHLAHEYLPWERRMKAIHHLWGRDPRSLAELREGVEDFYARWDWAGMYAWVLWISSRSDFQPLTEAQADELIRLAADDATLSTEQWGLLDALCLRVMLEKLRGRVRVVQLCWGTQYLARSTAPHPLCRAGNQFADSLGYLVQEFSDLHFNLLNGYEPHEPILCGLALSQANVSLGGYWWHTFYRSVMHTAWHRRLDMVPTAALCGFFSDGYCIDWVYGRLRMTQRILANVLADKIEHGFYSEQQALDVAREVLLEAPRRIFLPDEKF